MNFIMNAVVENKIKKLKKLVDKIIINGADRIFEFKDKSMDLPDNKIIKNMNIQIMKALNNLYNMLNAEIYRFQLIQASFSKKQYVSVKEWIKLIKDIKYSKKYKFYNLYHNKITLLIDTYDNNIKNGFYIN